MAKSGVTGGAETRAALKALRAALGAPLNEASKRAVEPMAEAAKDLLKRNGSVKAGRLYRIITVVRNRKRSSALRPVYEVGPDGSDPAYREAHLVEFGTAPHFQPELNRMHPGARPKPFMRPAFEQNKEGAVKIFADTIGPAIEKQADRLARRAAKKAAKK
ncbi:HK97-gp10 family putative phage morphogenesis protein [Pleomorphomonas carboxyditropha]|uniref:HK97-gp10 family putative phage morphogenesis protein n=1 Tax=Pleomorphomonas carboxyditropha TaxID=2023338 RepID=UPI0013FD40E3|nr:HK97-gp10 family putative phage morphogenesis protein [Pleomorphomonas carboxyditropha]